MNFVVIGTDHRFQHSEAGLKGILQWALSLKFPDLSGEAKHIQAIFEEYHEDIGEETVAKVLAKENKLIWHNVDMSDEQKKEAGIRDEQCARRENQPFARVPSDDVRESHWVEKLMELDESGAALVVCGYLHLEPFVKKLKDKGHDVSQRIYLEKLPV